MLASQEQAPALVREMTGGNRRKKKSKKQDADDDAHELFYERMQLTAELEEIIEALYADFRTLRLSATWDEHVVPTMRAWARSESVDAEAYAAKRSIGAAEQRVPSSAVDTTQHAAL